MHQITLGLLVLEIKLLSENVRMVFRLTFHFSKKLCQCPAKSLRSIPYQMIDHVFLDLAELEPRERLSVLR
jgi:hypothetical protein